MRLYTRSGDKGKTSIIGGRRDKDHIRVEAYGTCDELNAFVAKAAAGLDESIFSDIQPELIKIQHELFDCGSDLANVKSDAAYKVNAEMITFLEERIDVYIKEAPELERFILPGGSKEAADLHICRTITRRAERTTAALMKEEEINNEVFKYLNRLSDYFFAAARVANHRLHVKDVEYERSAIVFRSKKKKND
ncbi:ATP:cob(I)alamin adenosyltransferase [Alteribacillus persepolensis]|uniref:Corrinoid adenosyltransferase n=1 Tax=Alteribacillus persepolensis TaxID=568899 RepID=A0A1G7ZKG3_9BACI|nr:cob(I)yrinic acid a,c-diamide adenosyltransferase [Alteribacillus persepolensis]SDH09139.1 ATP:cob(I)alamin adenosyltransferase [Alteribacillus persepolensis]